MAENTFKRNQDGLLENVDYIRSETGGINWRAMLKPEHLALNEQKKKQIEKKYQKKISEIDIVNDKVEDSYLIILLSGIKYLSSLRGYSKVTYHPICAGLDFAATGCEIHFIGNFETAGETIIFSDQAGASQLNTHGIGQKYLIEMASNRAFCRAVRNFLGINIVSKQELSEDEEYANDHSEEYINPTSPHSLLSERLKNKGKTFEDIKKYLVTKKEIKEAENYTSLKDIPAKMVFELLDVLSKNGKNK